MMPICIASKGRAGKSKTIERLIEEGVAFKVFVEPQEAEAYRAAYPADRCEIYILPENNRGIGYVRQWVLEHSRAGSAEWYWTLDDDIQQTYHVIGGRCIKLSLSECLHQAEAIILQHEVALGALEYQQYAWSAKRPVKFNSYCDVAVLVNLERTRYINYRAHLNGKEDRDFVLQALATGQRSMRTCWLAFSAPKNGTNEGGLYDAYKAGIEAECSRRMVEAWPGVCTLNTKADGRPDVKIDWKQFAAETE